MFSREKVQSGKKISLSIVTIQDKMTFSENHIPQIWGAKINRQHGGRSNNK